MRRSMLFIPGNTPNLLMNGDVLGADSIIMDLEDAVSPAEKDSARILVRNILKSFDLSGIEVIIRINPVDSAYCRADLEEIVPCRPDLIMLPKSSTADDVKTLSAMLNELEYKSGIEHGSIRIMPLIETALGVENAFEIARADSRVAAIFLGAEDLTADLRCKRTKEGSEILYARQRLITAARAAGVDVYDTPFTDVNDTEGLEKDAAFAKALGFTGKAAISPRHVDGINAAFSPTREEINYAHAVMETIERAKQEGKGVVSLRGKMIDAPIVERAKQVLEMEKALFGGEDYE